jgi:hypothetical protein
MTLDAIDAVANRILRQLYDPTESEILRQIKASNCPKFYGSALSETEACSITIMPCNSTYSSVTISCKTVAHRLIDPASRVSKLVAGC